MNKVFIIFSCLLLLAVGVPILAVEQNRAEVILDLYNEKLNFLDSFLSPNVIDGLLLEEKISLETGKILRNAWIPYTSLHGKIISWCTDVKNTIGILDESSGRIRSGDEFASNVYIDLNELKEDFDSIVKDQLDDLNYAKKITTEALRKQDVATANLYNRENMLTKCSPILNTLEKPRGSAQKPSTNNDSGNQPRSSGGVTSLMKKHYISTTLLTILHFVTLFTLFSI